MSDLVREWDRFTDNYQGVKYSPNQANRIMEILGGLATDDCRRVFTNIMDTHLRPPSPAVFSQVIRDLNLKPRNNLYQTDCELCCGDGILLKTDRNDKTLAYKCSCKNSKNLAKDFINYK